MPSWSTQSPMQLYARAGGTQLQAAISSFGRTNSTIENAVINLRRKLMPFGLGMGVRLTYLRDKVIFIDDGKQLAVYDSISSLLFMMVEFLQVDSFGWSQLMNTLEGKNDFSLNKNIQFFLLRPLLDSNCKLTPATDSIAEEVFYRFALSDIYSPVDLYKEEMKIHREKNETLEREMQDSIEHVKKVMIIIDGKLSRIAKDFGVDEFLSTHLLSRALLSSSDAIYCSKFVQIMINSSQIDQVEMYEKLFSYLRGLLYSMTEEEANNYGLFLFDIWSSISSSRYCENPTINSEIYDKWHGDIACSLIMALLCTEKMISRVALKILIRIVSVYPTKAFVGDVFMKKLEPIQKEEGSNKVLANSYFGQLMKARNDGIWKEGDSEAKAKREQEEKAKQEQRREKLKLQDEALAAEVADYDRRFQGDRDKSRDVPTRRENERPIDRDRRPLSAVAPKFVPRGADSGKVDGKQPEGLEERWQRRGPMPDKRSFEPQQNSTDESNKRQRIEAPQERHSRGSGFRGRSTRSTFSR